MPFGRSALPFLTLCLVFSFVAAAPLAGLDLAITYRDSVESQKKGRGPTSTLQERYNPPDTCGCTKKYLQCTAKLANWNYIDSCNYSYFSCNSKCPGVDSVNRRDESDEPTGQGPDVEGVPSTRARVGGFFSGLASVFAGTIGNSNHNKLKETSRSLPFLVPSYANAGVYYTPPPKHKKPHTREDKGEPIVQPAPSTPWPPVKRGQDLSGLDESLERRDNTYTVVKGDTLYLIAKAHNVALAALTEANPQLNSSTNLSIGQVLNIPIQSVQQSTQTPLTGSTYTVVAGDTLYLIAKSHGVSLAALMVANPQLGKSTMLLVGQTLTIPLASGSPGKRSQQFCDCASFFTGKQLVSCVTICMKADTPQESAVNGKRDDAARPETSPQLSSGESETSSESGQTNYNIEGHSTEATSSHQKDIHEGSSPHKSLGRSLPYIPAPYAQPHRENLDYGNEDEGLDKGVLLFFFSCLMAPVLLVVWLGRRMGYGSGYLRVRSED